MVEFSYNKQHLSVILQYFEAVKVLVDQLTVENLDDRLAVFGEALQQIKDSNVSCRSSLSEFNDIYKDQEILLEDDPFYVNIILLLLQQGSDAISDGKIFLVLDSKAIFAVARRIIESNYLKILSESHPPAALVYIRSTLIELAKCKLCNITFVTRYETINQSFVCTPVPSDHIQLYLEVARSRVVRAAFLELDVDYTDQRLDRVIEYISSSNKLHYATMSQDNYGLTCSGYVYLNLNFSDPEVRIQNMLRLLTLLHETAHVIVRIDVPAELWSAIQSPPRFIAYELRLTEDKQIEEGFALEAKIFKKAPGYVYINVLAFLLEVESWNKELSDFQDEFINLQEVGRIKRLERILVCSNTAEGCVPGVKCGIMRFRMLSRLNQDEQDSCKKHLTFQDIAN